MIQYYLDLKKQVKAIEDAQLQYGQVQKIYSTSVLVSFSIRTPGKTWHLYLGRGNGHEGAWLHDEAPPSILRRKDTFLEYLRRHVSSCAFIGLEIDRDDRIVKFSYQKFGKEQSLLFFWKGRTLYFVHHYQDSPESPFKLLLSWHGRAIIPNEDTQDLFEYFNEVGRREGMSHDLSSQNAQTIEELLAEEAKAAEKTGQRTAPTFLQRKITNIESDLSRARQWEKMQSILDKGQDLDGIYELEIGDHKVKFEGELNAYERRNLLFEKIKKLKRGENILGQRLQDAKEQLAGKLTQSNTESKLPMAKPVWGKNEKLKLVEQARATKEEYKVFKFEDFSVGVGLTSQGNDQLRGKWASKDDTWVHLDGAKSAHAIIKLHSGTVATPEAMNLAASIVAHFSHVNSEWISIIFTAVKNLKGVTGSPGMVIYKKEKHLRCQRIHPEQWLKE